MAAEQQKTTRKIGVPRFPGDIMLYPLSVGLLLHSFFPQVLEIGSFTTAVAKGSPAIVGIDDLGDSDTIAAAVHKGNSSLLEFINNEITGPLAEENFFHKAYEETLAPIYGDEVDPNTMVVEGGKI